MISGFDNETNGKMRLQISIVIVIQTKSKYKKNDRSWALFN